MQGQWTEKREDRRFISDWPYAADQTREENFFANTQLQVMKFTVRAVRSTPMS